MLRRTFLLLPLATPAAADPAPRYSSDVLRRRAEEEARLREEWWARERERQAAEQRNRTLQPRPPDRDWQIQRWEEQRQQRVWGRLVPP